MPQPSRTGAATSIEHDGYGLEGPGDVAGTFQPARCGGAPATVADEHPESPPPHHPEGCLIAGGSADMDRERVAVPGTIDDPPQRTSSIPRDPGYQPGAGLSPDKANLREVARNPLDRHAGASK
jgi:hypothetical protein